MKSLIRVALLAAALLQLADGKRTKSKKLASETDESTPKPSVLTYSNFGFNDVGSYDGFVPTSPDYATLLSSKESSTRLYAPAFPTALDTSGFGGNYASSDGQPSDEQLQTSMSKYQSGNLNYFTSPSFDNLNDPNKFVSVSSSVDLIEDDTNSPVYGAKLNYPKQAGKMQYNPDYNSEYNASKDVISNINAEAYTRNQDTFIQSDKKQGSADLHVTKNYPSYQSPFPKYTTTTVTPPEYENPNMNTPISASAIKFPRVIDFTNMNSYFTKNVNVDVNSNNFQNPSLDINQFRINTDDKFSNANNNLNNDFDKNTKPFPHLKYTNLNLNKEEQKTEKDVAKFNYLSNQEFSQNYFTNKNKLKGKYTFNYDKLKKPWDYSSKDESGKKPSPIRYEYTTNHTIKSSKFGNPFKRPFNSSIDEIAPASSNLDFYNYQYPEIEFGNIKNNPFSNSPFTNSDSNDFGINFPEKYKPIGEYQSSLKNFYTTPPTVTSHWGNLFKSSGLTSHKTHIRKPVLQEENDDIVHIPKRPSSGKYGPHFESNTFSDWAQSYKPHPNKGPYEWPKDNNRYKSEEDLLDLRNHDLVHPSYPPFRPAYNEPPEDFDYKKLVDKWKQSYLKSKYKDSVREYETYASETKPYPIEVPHPVIVPVPQPYPVHVPVPRPVAIPVIRELTVPIEKPVPYPVYKKVPYPVEKPVPVPVEKQVHVPIMKPYPVAVPQVRPLFHHTRPHDERDPDEEDDEDYQIRPESSKRIPNLKRPKNKRQPPRRPSRMTYQDRDRRRGPQRRPPLRDQRHRYPQSERRPHRHHEEYDEYESDYAYCRRTGNC